MPAASSASPRQSARARSSRVSSPAARSRSADPSSPDPPASPSSERLPVGNRNVSGSAAPSVPVPVACPSSESFPITSRCETSPSAPPAASPASRSSRCTSRPTTGSTPRVDAAFLAAPVPGSPSASGNRRVADDEETDSASPASAPPAAKAVAATRGGDPPAGRHGSKRSGSATAGAGGGRNRTRAASGPTTAKTCARPDGPVQLVRPSGSAPAASAVSSVGGATAARLPGPGLTAPSARVADRYRRSRARVAATYSSRLVSSSSRLRRSRSAADRNGATETEGSPSPPSATTRIGGGGPPAPRASSTRKTTGNSSPFAAWTVIRLTASNASTTAFDTSPESRSTWSAMRARVAKPRFCTRRTSPRSFFRFSRACTRRGPCSSNA